MKYLLCILLFCSTCFAEDKGDIKSILVEKKEPATAVCYVAIDPMTLSIAVDIPYKEVSFLFADKSVDEKQPNIWIMFKEGKPSFLLFGDKKVSASILNKTFLEKLSKLKAVLETKIT